MTPYEPVTVSDLERTTLDGLARPDLCAGVSQVAAGLWMRQDDCSWTKMPHYAPLDPLLPDKGRHLAPWRLPVNLEPETLQAVVTT